MIAVCEEDATDIRSFALRSLSMEKEDGGALPLIAEVDDFYPQQASYQVTHRQATTESQREADDHQVLHHSQQLQQQEQQEQQHQSASDFPSFGERQHLAIIIGYPHPVSRKSVELTLPALMDGLTTHHTVALVGKSWHYRLQNMQHVTPQMMARLQLPGYAERAPPRVGLVSRRDASSPSESRVRV